jgi:hypothetical protein
MDGRSLRKVLFPSCHCCICIFKAEVTTQAAAPDLLMLVPAATVETVSTYSMLLHFCFLQSGTTPLLTLELPGQVLKIC